MFGTHTMPMIQKFRPRSSCLIVAGILAAQAGCNIFLPIIFLGEHKKSLPAEFDKLTGKRMAVLVWADPATLFDYPHVRLELASYSADKIRVGVEKCDVVDPYHVEDFLDRNPEATVDPRKVGEQFEADLVVYVELLEFQIRDAVAPDLCRGRIRATVAVHDLRAEADEINRYTLAPVEVIYPENHPVLMSSRNAQIVRRNAYEQFSEKLARKFFEHQVEL